MESILIVIWICVVFARGDLIVSSFEELGGEIIENTVFNDSSSAYKVSNNLIILSNTTLTIEQGCRLRFQPGTGIIVRGSLVILGTSDHRVIFGPDNDKVSMNETPTVAADVRLSGGSTAKEGKLEIYLDGRWSSVCSSSWDDIETDLACRLLGYTTGAMHPVVIDDDDYWLDTDNYWLTDFSCYGNESSFTNCIYTENDDYGSYYMLASRECDDRSIVSLECEGTGPNYGNSTWAGITWDNADAIEEHYNGVKTFKSKSQLQHLEVYLAGISDDLRQRPAMESYGIPPRMVSVLVKNSFGDGVSFKDIPTETDIMDSIFSHNNGIGLSLSTTVTGRVVIGMSEVNNNRLGGLNLNHTSVPSDIYKKYDGVCSINATEILTYPVYIQSNLDADCETVFRVDEGQRIYIHVYEDFGYLVDVRDGDISTAPILVSSYGFETYAISTGSNLWVKVKSMGFRKRLRLLVTVYKDMLNTFELNDIYIHDNRLNGITADLHTASIIIRNSFILDNELNGILLQEGEAVQIESVVADKNELSGVKFLNTNGNVTVTNCSFNSNGIGLSAQRTHGIQMIVSVTESTVRDNQMQGILLDSADMRVQVVNNYVAENDGGLVVKERMEKSLTKIIIAVSHNVFEDNSQNSLYFGSVEITKIQVDNNFISSSFLSESLITGNYSGCYECYFRILNNTFLSSLTFIGIHIEESGDGAVASIWNNIFQNITCKHLIKISGNMNSPHDIGLVSTQENKFVESSPLIKSPGSQQPSAIFSEVGNIMLRHNFFMDFFDVKLIIDFEEPTAIIPAQWNWWGFDEEEDIQRAIVDKQDHINLAMVAYFPYLGSANTSDVILQRAVDNSTFLQNGFVIGGLMTGNITLSAKNEPYIVEKNIIVCHSCVLKLEPGVKVTFQPYTGIQVHGVIYFSGSIENQIELSLKNISENFDQTAYKLAVGGDGSEGILLENHEGTWQPSCVDNDDEILQQICMNLGYQGMMGYEYLEDGNKEKSCRPTDITCKTSGTGTKSCTSGSQVYLKCVPIKWAGVRIFSDAKPSIINHVIIRDAGSHFDGTFHVVPAIHVDYNRHTLKNIIISSSQAGVMVITSNPFTQNAQLNNITINGCHEDMYAFKGVFPPLSLSNINITDCNRGMLYEGFTSTKLIEFNEEQTIDLAEHQCFGNVSLESGDVMYFSLENGMVNGRQECIDTIFVDDGNFIGVHIVRAKLLNGGMFSIYDDDENALLTLDEKKQGTFSIMSKGSTILLKYTSGQEQLDTGELVVFIQALPDGVPVNDIFLSLFLISNMEFDLLDVEASGTGIEVNYLERYHSLTVTQSTIRLNGVGSGVVIQGHGTVILDDVIISDVGMGIQLDSFAGEFTLIDSDLVSSDVGMEIGGRYKSDETANIATHVMFSRITNSLSSALHVRDEPRLKKLLNIIGCNFTGNYVTVRLTGCNESVFIEDVIILQSMRGIEMNDFAGNIDVNNSFISVSDRAIDASSTTQFPSKTFGHIHSTHFTGHTYIVMHLRELAKAQSIKRTRDWLIIDCTFQENTNVIKLDAPTMMDKRQQSLVVSGCTFQQNQGTLINVIDGSVHVIIFDNTFYENRGSSIQTGIIESHSLLNISFNTFDSNVAGIEDFVRISGDIAKVEISANQFINNECHSVMYIYDSRQIHRSKILSDSLMISHNNITSNKPDSKHTGEMSCAVKIDLPRGSVMHNILNNEDFLLEICSNAVLFDETSDVIKATYNWWGTIDNEVIEDRIIDISDRNDIVSIEHSPYLTSNDINASNNFINYSSPLDANNRFSGGKVKGELALTLLQSPYEIRSDITVLHGSLLKIEAGVVLQFHPNIGILVLGDLVAEGDENNVIQMESIRSKMKTNPTLRLTGGTIPSEGRLEMLINNKWTRICRQSWKMSEATVACGQMGYAPPVHNQWLTNAFDETSSQINNATFNCRGNELDLNDCVINTTVCQEDFDVGLMCVSSSVTQMGLAWGGIRLMSTSAVQKTGSPNVASAKVKTLILRHVDIYDAGYLHNTDGAALSLSHVSPIIEDVRIYNSVSKGIEILTPLQPFILERILVDDCVADGITLTRGTDIADILFDSVELLGNDIGLHVTGFTGGLYANEYVGLHDICSMNDVTITDFLMGYFDRYSERNSECTVIIRSAGIDTHLNIAVRRLDFMPGKDTLKVYDGSEYDGEVIAEFSQSSTDDKLTLESKTDTVTLKLSYAAGSIKRYYIFEVTTKEAGELSQIVTTSTIARSKSNAILFTGLGASFEMSQSHILHNNVDVTADDHMATVRVAMNSGNINISQCVFEDNSYGALLVDVGRSNEVKAKHISVAITDSEFASNVGGSTLAVSSHYEAPIDTVNALVSGNIIANNTAATDSSIIEITGVKLSIQKNLIRENLGKTLDWTGIKSVDIIVMVANAFYFNKASKEPTISISGKGLQFLFTQNSFTDHDNVIELTALFDDNTNKEIHAAGNWWGMTSPELIQTRVVTDDGENQGNIDVTIKPLLQTPVATVYDFDCPIGFTRIGQNCYQLRSGVRGYEEASRVCNKLSAVVTSVDYFDIIAVQTLMTDREPPDSVWVNQDSYQTGSELDQECTSYDPVTNTTNMEPCNQWLSFVCKTFTVGMCHELDTYVDEAEGSGNDLFTCEEVSSCSMRGRCIAPNSCHCYVGFEGKTCRMSAPSNQQPPLFSGVQERIFIEQNSPKGTLIAHIRAIDKNYDRNEKFCFYLIPNAFSEMVNLNSKSGIIHLKHDAKKIKQRSLKLAVAARDAGSPPKSSMVKIAVNIIDNTASCPDFEESSSYIIIDQASIPSHKVYIRAVVANLKTVYYALYEHAATERFKIGELSGVLTLSDELPAGRYSFVVTAYTTGDGSCVSGQIVTVEVKSQKDETLMFSSTTYGPTEKSDPTPTPHEKYPKDCNTFGCKNGGSCINDVCMCPCPFTGEFCQTESHCIEVSMKIERIFGQPALYDLRLGDTSDHLFLSYAEAVQEFVENAVYTNDILAGSYLGNTVTRFIEGSLVVEYQVTFDKKSMLTQSDFQQVLKTALSEYNVDDSIRVDTGSISTSENDENNNNSGNKTDDDGVDIGGGMVAIIVIICLGVIAVVVVAIVLLIRRKRKRRSYYDNLRGNPIKMDTVKRTPVTQDGEEVTYRNRSEPLENSSEEPL